MGSIAISSPFTGLGNSLVVQNQNLPGMGSALTAYKYTGSNLSFDLSLDATGNATVPAWPTVPADAVGMEVWSSSTTAGDGIAFALRAGILSGTGVLATNAANNKGASGSQPSRFTDASTHMVLPFQTVGAVPSTWRFALLVTSGQKLQGRYISQAAGFPYLMAGAEEFLVVGTANIFTLPTGTAAKFPSGYCGAVIQVIGSGVRFTMDGSAPGAAVGDLIAAGTYWVDQAKHGVSLAALRFWMPSGTFLVGSSLTYA